MATQNKVIPEGVPFLFPILYPLKLQSIEAKLSFPTHWSSTGVRLSGEKILCTE